MQRTFALFHGTRDRVKLFFQNISTTQLPDHVKSSFLVVAKVMEIILTPKKNVWLDVETAAAYKA